MPAPRVPVSKLKRIRRYVGEPIRYKATLTNVGSSDLYISKRFFRRLGGVAGFEVGVKQLKGKPAHVGCGEAADPGLLNDSRSAEQILEEDFLRLPPGAHVGYRSRYRGCVVANTGTYQMTATYCACDLNTGKVRSIADKSEQILIGEIESAPVTFYVSGSNSARPTK